jgi:hypothetical protein
MHWRLAPLLAVGLLAPACAGEFAAPAAATMAPLAAFAPASAPVATTSGAAPARPARPRRDRGPFNGQFVLTHFSAGMFSTLLVQSATYVVVAKVGETGHGLAPVVGALLIGAFIPPILNYTVQWAFGRGIAPGRDRFWPGFLVRQVVHLGIFAGAVAGGADFRNLGQAAALVVGDAVVGSGLATLTAELTRRPRATPVTPGTTVVVPVLEVKF